MVSRYLFITEAKKMNWNFQGLTFSGTILPYSKAIKK